MDSLKNLLNFNICKKCNIIHYRKSSLCNQCAQDFLMGNIKYCKECKKWKNIIDFYYNSSSLDKVNKKCIICLETLYPSDPSKLEPWQISVQKQFEF